jgi:hypothetical protein
VVEKFHNGSAERPGQVRSGQIPEHKRGEARELVAAATGKSEKTVRKAETVIAAAEADPALAGRTD